MIDFACRNLILFFKDKSTVLLSFLAEFIIIGLYFLFIRSNLLAGFSSLPDAGLLLDIWMIAGILGTASVTIPLGAYAIMVEDKARSISRDFNVSPVRSFSLSCGYLAGAAVISLLLSTLLLLLSEAYLYQRYGVRLGARQIPSLLFLLPFTTLSNAALVMLPVSCLRSSSSLAACCTVVGALIGFLTGIYLPLGALPEKIQWIVKGFPPSHSTALFRQVLLKPFLSQSFADPGALQQFELYMGVRFSRSGSILPESSSLLLLLCTTTACLLLLFCGHSSSG